MTSIRALLLVPNSILIFILNLLFLPTEVLVEFVHPFVFPIEMLNMHKSIVSPGQLVSTRYLNLYSV